MKKFVRLASFIAFLVAAMALIGCSKNTTVDEEWNKQVIDADFGAIADLYKDSTITADVALTSDCANGTKVTWTSSDTTILGNDGKIATLANGGLLEDGSLPTVTMTATLTYGGLTKTHEVTYTVDKKSDDAKAVEGAIAAYNTTYYLTTLTGFKISFDENGKPVYTLDIVNRDGVQIELIDTPHLKYEGFKATVIPPTDEELKEGETAVTEPLTIKFTVGGCTVTKKIDCLIAKDTNKFYTVAEAKADMNKEGWNENNQYVIRGVVSAMYQSVADNATSGYQGFYVEQDGVAIYVYSASVSNSVAVVHPGDEILMTTKITDYYGLFETNGVSAIQVIGTKAIPEKIVITPENFNKNDLAGKDGRLATCQQLVYISGTMETNVSARITVALPDGTVTSLTCDKRAVGFETVKEVINSLKAGDCFEFDGVIGWYNKPQFTVYSGNGVKKTDATLTDAQIFAIDKNVVSVTVPSSVNPLSESTLTTAAPLGTSIVWSIVEEGTPASINEGKLVVANFTEPLKITLTAKLVRGNLEFALENEYEVALVSPSTLTEAIAAMDSTDGLAANTVVILPIISKLDDATYVAYENGKYVMVNVGEVTGFDVNKKILATVSSAAIDNGTYKMTVKELLSSENNAANIAGTMVALNELTSAFAKVQLKNATIANGAAQVNDTVTVKFYTDATKKTAYADGTYYGIEGYALYSSDTEIAFIVTGTYNSYKEIVTDSATKITLRGVVVIYGGGSNAWIASDEGILFQIYKTDIFKNGNIALGEYVEITTTVQYYNACYETKTIDGNIVRFANEAPYTRADIAEAVRTNEKTTVLGNLGYEGQTQNTDKYKTITVSGWKFLRAERTYKDESKKEVVEEITLKAYDPTLEADTETASKTLPSNIILSDSEGHEVYVYSYNASYLDVEMIQTFINKLIEARDSNGSISFNGFINNTYSGSTITKYVIMMDFESLVITK